MGRGGPPARRSPDRHAPKDERLLDAKSVAELRAAALRFGGEHSVRKLRALVACASGTLDDASVLVAYHDCLLCLLASETMPSALHSNELRLDTCRYQTI